MFLAFFLLLILVPFGWTTSISRTEPTISECAAKGGECDESKGRPVCGTDNQTYPTRCHLIRAQCIGHQVSLKHRGSCKECFESRQYALSHRTSSPNKFVPRCRSDGSYAQTQCMEGAGCWCSDSQGKPIPNTTTRSGKPNCLKKSKTNIRRSPLRNVNRNRRGCSRADHAQFNVNLLKVFQNEYNRYHGRNGLGNAPDKMVLDWKYGSLDTNGNHVLDKTEYRELRRLIRKVVKPKRCARAFGKFCDIDHNEQLSLQEWTNCFSKNNHNHETNHAPSASTNYGGSSDGSDSASNDDYDDDNYDDESDESNINSKYNTLKPRPFTISAVNTSYPSIYLIRPKTIADTDPVLRETESESDCLADRALALDEQKAHFNGEQGGYIPECTADGRYQRVQCYRSVGYCWCVHEDTGKNIPGTSIKDGRPDCVTNSSRPMKGCPHPKKVEFLKELKEFLRTQVTVNANTGANATKFNSEDEKLATLSFVLLDKNKNRLWERREWKTFRELVTSSVSLKKCGKKMPRYCDINNDKQITLSEWLNCLQVNSKAPESIKAAINETRPTLQSSKLKGPNPLESYLKSD